MVMYLRARFAEPLGLIQLFLHSIFATRRNIAPGRRTLARPIPASRLVQRAEAWAALRWEFARDVAVDLRGLVPPHAAATLIARVCPEPKPNVSRVHLPTAC